MSEELKTNEIDLKDAKSRAYERINKFNNISNDRKASMKETIDLQDTPKEIANKVDSYIQENASNDQSQRNNSANNSSSDGFSVFKFLVYACLLAALIYVIYVIGNGFLQGQQNNTNALEEMNKTISSLFEWIKSVSPFK